jgi:L-fucose isomerase-like protein
MQNGSERLLLFGGLPSAYLAEWEITGDLTLAEHKLGVRFESVPHDDLVARYTSLDEQGQREALRLAEELIQGASARRTRSLPPAPPQAAVVDATRLYVAMRQFVEARHADAVTVTCEPWIRGEGLPVPCVGLMLFQEQGIPAACQGDIDALLTMVLFQRVSGQSSFMGGAIKAQRQLGLSHCIICRNLPGPSTDLQSYLISNYHGRKESPTVWAEVPAGETVTVARLTQDLKRLLLLTGKLLGSQTDNAHCRNTLIIDVPDRERVIRAVKGIQNHYVAAVGDHARALTELASAAGIDIVRLDRT